jgi:selT/selW/selH-like putative selenoprotein
LGDVNIEMIESSGGVFEIDVAGKRIFSKESLGRFPAYQEIPTLIATG